LPKPFKDAQELLEGDKYVTITHLPIAIKDIRAALIRIVGAEARGMCCTEQGQKSSKTVAV
jgi:hypothetical protein